MPIGEYEIRATRVVASKRLVVVGGIRQAPGGITDVRIDRMSRGTYDATYRTLIVPVTFVVRRNVAFVPMPPGQRTTFAGAPVIAPARVIVQATILVRTLSLADSQGRRSAIEHVGNFAPMVYIKQPIVVLVSPMGLVPIEFGSYDGSAVTTPSNQEESS